MENDSYQSDEGLTVVYTIKKLKKNFVEIAPLTALHVHLDQVNDISSLFAIPFVHSILRNFPFKINAHIYTNFEMSSNTFIDFF